MGRCNDMLDTRHSTSSARTTLAWPGIWRNSVNVLRDGDSMLVVIANRMEAWDPPRCIASDFSLT